MSPDALVDARTPPSATNGYISGMFSGWVSPVGARGHYAFVFVDMGSGKEYTLPFFEAKDGGQLTHKLRLVEVPPGHYRFSRWASYRASNGEILATSDQAPANLGDIVVSPSRVTFIGGFEVRNEYVSVSETRYVVTPVQVQAHDLAKELSAQYPGYLPKEK